MSLIAYIGIDGSKNQSRIDKCTADEHLALVLDLKSRYNTSLANRVGTPT
jgi:hypothetical protein